jgi:hypothetical protein
MASTELEFKNPALVLVLQICTDFDLLQASKDPAVSYRKFREMLREAIEHIRKEVLRAESQMAALRESTHTMRDLVVRLEDQPERPRRLSLPTETELAAGTDPSVELIAMTASMFEVHKLDHAQLLDKVVRLRARRLRFRDYLELVSI